MGVQLNKTYNFNSNIIKCFEKVSETLILFNITVKNDSVKLVSRPIHFRYDFGDFPPLDISFDSESGLLREITIFINEINIKSFYKMQEIALINLKGFPSFTFDRIEKHEYYYDEVCQMEIYLSALSLFVCISDKEIHTKIIVNEELDILLNVEDEFIGFVVNHLSINDVEFLKNRRAEY